MKNMINRLLRFFTRSSDRPPEPAQLSADDDTPVNHAALADFVRLVSRHLGEEKSAKLEREVLQSEEEPLLALTEAGYAEKELHLVIGVDWKAYDEVEWQVDALLAGRGIDQRWAWDLPEDPHGRTVMNALKALERWLRPRALTLLHIDSGGDDYHCLIIEPDLVEQAVALGTEASMAVLSHKAFLIQQRDEDAEG